MSGDWSSLLKQALTALRNRKQPRIAVVGVGHELRGDDVAGVLVTRALKPAFAERQDILVVDGGHVPENFTGLLRRFTPDLVLMVDTAEMDEPPGTVRWLAWQEASGLSASTHTMPPYLIARYLNSDLGCEVALIGIQPAQTGIGAALSPPMQGAVREVATILAQIL